MKIETKFSKLDLFFTLKFFINAAAVVKFSLSLWIILTIWGFIIQSFGMIAIGILLLSSSLIFIAILEIEKVEISQQIEKWREEH